VHLPQRPVAWERVGHAPVDDLVQPPRLGANHVPVEVEVAVVDPDRRVEVERHPAQHLPVARRAVKAGGDVLAQGLEAGTAAVRRKRWVEYRGPADVHVGTGRLDAQKRGVHR
jgi:hypothetical protein